MRKINFIGKNLDGNKSYLVNYPQGREQRKGFTIVIVSEDAHDDDDDDDLTTMIMTMTMTIVSLQQLQWQ